MSHATSFSLFFSVFVSFFFFNDTATTEIYTLSLHDALPISVVTGADRMGSKRRHRGEHARAHHGDREIQTCPEPGGSESRTPGTADHDRMGKSHRHLRQIGGGKRAGDGDGRAHFRGDASVRKHAEKRSSHLLRHPRASGGPGASDKAPMSPRSPLSRG